MAAEEKHGDLFAQARQHVENWRKMSNKQKKEKELELAFHCQSQAIVKEEVGKHKGTADDYDEPLAYMELATLAYRTYLYEEMATALAFLINKYPDWEHIGLALYLSALMLFIKGQYKESLKCYSILLIKPPQHSFPPASFCLDLLPPMVYGYSCTLETTLVYEKLGDLEMVEQGLKAIHQRLRRKRFELDQQAEAVQNKESWPSDYEEFNRRIKAMDFPTWSTSALVWKARLERFMEAEHWMIAAILSHKLAMLLIEEYANAYAYRQLRRRQIAEALLIKAECYGRLHLLSYAYAPAKVALEWVHDDPVYNERALPFIEATQADPMLHDQVEKQVKSARLIEKAARYKIQEAQHAKAEEAAIKIQKVWKEWDVWNQAAAIRLRFHSLTNVHPLLREYEHARPAQRALVLQAVREADRAIQAISAVLHMLIAYKRLQTAKRAAKGIQRIIRGYQTRLHLRDCYSSGYLPTRRPGRKSQQYLGRDYPHDTWLALHPIVTKPIELPKPKMMMVISCSSVASRSEERKEEEKEEGDNEPSSQADHRWMPFCVTSDAQVIEMCSESTTAIISSKCFNGFDILRLNRLLLHHQPQLNLLTTLLIYKTSIGSMGLKALAIFLQSATSQITTLGLGDNQMGIHRGKYTHQGLRALVKSFNHPHSRLTKFHLEADPTLKGDECAVILLPEIQRSKNIHSVALRGLGITHQVVHLLANTILVSKALKVLDLNHNHLSHEGVDRLLQILWDAMRTTQEEERLRFRLCIQQQCPPLIPSRLREIAQRSIQNGHHDILFQVTHNGIELYGKHSFVADEDIIEESSSRAASEVDPDSQPESHSEVVNPELAGSASARRTQKLVKAQSQASNRREKSLPRKPGRRRINQQQQQEENKGEKEHKAVKEVKKLYNNEEILVDSDSSAATMGARKKELAKQLNVRRRQIDAEEYAQLNVKSKILF